MPRTPRKGNTPVVVIPSNSLVASAVRYPGKAARIYQPNQDWQRECYRHYAICGEARFAARFFGHALSRTVLSIAKKGKGGKVIPKASGSAVDFLESLFNGPDGQAQMMDAIGIHLTIAGECYLVGRKVSGGELWEIVSCLEMNVQGNRWTIKYGGGMPDVPLTDDDVVIRIWLPNPGRRIEADSPFRSLLPILTEIEYLTRHIFAQTTSRLAGAGVWILPQSISFPTPPAIDGKEQKFTTEVDAAMAVLAEAMMKPFEDPGNSAALVPIIFQVPDESIQYIKEAIHFWSDLDAAALEMRSEAIRRFALGMELPPEQMLGMSSNGGTGGGNSNGVSHWGAWQIEESTIKMFVEPMVETVVNALTIGYIRPLTDDVDDVVVYSTAALRLRPDRSKEAVELFDRGLLSLAALFREIGFDVSDLIPEAELKTWLLRKVASGSATPDQVGAALSALGVDLGVAPQGGDSPTPRESRPAPTLEEHPSRPRTPADSALTAASEALVFRALERAGNRIRQKGIKPPNTPSYEVHCHALARGLDPKHLLDDAWATAPQILEGIGDPERVIAALDAYCTALLIEGSPHKRDRLVGWLNLLEEAG